MRKLFLVFIFVALIITACSGTPTKPAAVSIPSEPTPSKAELEVSDPAKPIEVTAGNEFTITVKTNLPSEYHWEVGEALDTKFVEYVWKNHVPDDPNNPSSSGKDVWRFKAIAPGKTTITLGYYQGMTENAPQKPVFTIVVK